LKRNLPELRKPWINNKIIRDIEREGSIKNVKNTHGIWRYKKFKNQINREAEFSKDK